MLKVACTKKELSCIISQLIGEVQPLCNCHEDPEDRLVISGKLPWTGESVKIIVTEYGCEFYGDESLIESMRKTRCPNHGAINTPKES